MYWICIFLLLLLTVSNTIGDCTFYVDESRYKIVKCISVEESEIMTFMKYESVDKLIIEESFIPHIEIFPSVKFNSLTIRNSSVETFLPTSFDIQQLLDLSYNEIRDAEFLKNTQVLEIVMHHNKIEFLNGANLYDDIRTLDLSYNNIKNITPMKQRKLISLNLSNNKLENLTKILDDLFSVNSIDLSYNKLKTIGARDTAGLGNLKCLNLSHNNIISFDSTGDAPYPLLTEESFIDLSFNEIKSPNKNSKYYYLISDRFISIYLGNNQLESIDSLISNRSKMIHNNSMIMSQNNIKKLYPLNFQGSILKKLDLSLNGIEYIFPSTFEGLQVTELRLEHNEISSLNYSSFAGLSGLRKLNLSYNPLISIDEETFSKLSHELSVLDLSHCLLEKVPPSLFQNGKSLSEVYLSHNNIEIVEPNSFVSLRILDLSSNRIKILPSNIFANLKISTLDISFNPLESLENVFNNSSIENLLLKGISLNKLSEKKLRGLENFEYLDLSNTGIVELSNNTFDQLVLLKKISLDNNSIEMIPRDFFGFNTKLMYLSIVGNPISKISEDSFSHKMKLKYLNMTIMGEITNLSFQNLIFLEELHFPHSWIKRIHKNSFKGLINLETLSFENSTVVDVMPGAFSGLGTVQNFDERNLFTNINTIKSRTFVGLESLRTLNFSSMVIKVIEDYAFYGLRDLLSLILSRNDIGALSQDAFSGLKNLQILDLSYNNLDRDLPIGTFRDLTKLRELHLQHNSMGILKEGWFTNLEKLRVLNLSHNDIFCSSPDPILSFPLKNLEVLDINFNCWKQLEYEGFPPEPLKTIGIGENKWPCNYVVNLLRRFEQNKVDYRNISALNFTDENVKGIFCIYN